MSKSDRPPNVNFFGSLGPPQTSLLLSRSDLAKAKLPARLRKRRFTQPTKKYQAIQDWPPRDFKTDLFPTTPSLDAFKQWLDYWTHPRVPLDLGPSDGLTVRADRDCSEFVRDASLLIRDLKDRGLLNIPYTEEVRPYTAHEAKAVLSKLKEQIFSRNACAVSPGQAECVGSQTPTIKKLSPTKKQILSMCRRQTLTGIAISRRLELNYDHTRRELAKLVKAGHLKSGSDGYRTVRAT
jgi:hypothetical protein